MKCQDQELTSQDLRLKTQFQRLRLQHSCPKTSVLRPTFRNPSQKNHVPRTKTNVPRTKTIVPRTKTNVPRTKINVPRTKTNVPKTMSIYLICISLLPGCSDTEKQHPVCLSLSYLAVINRWGYLFGRHISIHSIFMALRPSLHSDLLNKQCPSGSLHSLVGLFKEGRRKVFSSYFLKNGGKCFCHAF